MARLSNMRREWGGRRFRRGQCDHVGGGRLSRMTGFVRKFRKKISAEMGSLSPAGRYRFGTKLLASLRKARAHLSSICRSVKGVHDACEANLKTKASKQSPPGARSGWIVTVAGEHRFCSPRRTGSRLDHFKQRRWQSSLPR